METWQQRRSSTWRRPRLLRNSRHLQHKQMYVQPFVVVANFRCLTPSCVAQGALLLQHRDVERTVPGLHTESESGSARSASGSDSARSRAGGAADGFCSPAASLSARRLRRTHLALVLLQRSHWALLHRTREYHRRFVVRSGHIGSRVGHHAAAVRRVALRQTQLRRCASPGCEALAMELCTHCFTHVCQERGQQLYRLDGSVLRLVTDEDSDVEEVSDISAAPAPAASEFESGAGMDNGQSSVSNSGT